VEARHAHGRPSQLPRQKDVGGDAVCRQLGPVPTIRLRPPTAIPPV
jgi:hypothetical protein